MSHWVVSMGLLVTLSFWEQRQGMGSQVECEGVMKGGAFPCPWPCWLSLA